MKKIDDYILEVITRYVLKWIKKNKFIYHKYDLFIKVITWETAWWVFSVMYQAYNAIVKGLWISSTLMAILMCIIIAFEFTKLRQLKSMKEEYDWMWERRKNPNIYKIVKEMCETLFEESRKMRQFSLKINIVFAILMLIFNPILTPIYLFLIISSYVNYIFDFEEPPKKDKKVKDSITDIAMRAWKQLTVGLNPT